MSSTSKGEPCFSYSKRIKTMIRVGVGKKGNSDDSGLCVLESTAQGLQKLEIGRRWRLNRTCESCAHIKVQAVRGLWGPGLLQAIGIEKVTVK